jgi:beta-lactamase superfamily II metal-dependent hydrolase
VRLADGRVGWAAKKFLIEPSGPPPNPNNSSIPANAWLEVHFLDVGQGDGIWICTFDDGVANGRFEGRNIIIDGGPNASDEKNEMLRYVESKAHHNAIVDALFITHPHDDHFPGAEGILRHFDVKSYYDRGYPKNIDSPTSSYQNSWQLFRPASVISDGVTSAHSIGAAKSRRRCCTRTIRA